MREINVLRRNGLSGTGACAGSGTHWHASIRLRTTYRLRSCCAQPCCATQWRQAPPFWSCTRRTAASACSSRQPPAATAADADALRTVLSSKLTDFAAPSFEELWGGGAAAAWSDSAAASPAQAQAELASNLDAMLAVLTPAELTRLLLAQPALVAAPLAAWTGFLGGMGFSHAEQKNILIGCPEVSALVGSGVLPLGWVCCRCFDQKISLDLRVYLYATHTTHPYNAPHHPAHPTHRPSPCSS